VLLSLKSVVERADCSGVVATDSLGEQHSDSSLHHAVLDFEHAIVHPGRCLEA
jgi:hypothetical protein